jgi:hypothetical protein
VVETAQEQTPVANALQDDGEGKDDMVGIQVRERGWVYWDVVAEVGNQVEEPGRLEARAWAAPFEGEGGQGSCCGQNGEQQKSEAWI